MRLHPHPHPRPQTAAFAAPSFREAQRAEAAAAALRAAPELDRARATAFADTVDALYGVISDQRRAATDHSRRMKWMLSIVVGALLMTVAIGITQTVLLMRLTRETTAQQHRIEQMMQNQQAAMASLLDTHLAMANAAAANAASDAAATRPASRGHARSWQTRRASTARAQAESSQLALSFSDRRAGVSRPRRCVLPTLASAKPPAAESRSRPRFSQRNLLTPKYEKQGRCHDATHHGRKPCGNTPHPRNCCIALAFA